MSGCCLAGSEAKSRPIACLLADSSAYRRLQLEPLPVCARLETSREQGNLNSVNAMS